MPVRSTLLAVGVGLAALLPPTGGAAPSADAATRHLRAAERQADGSAPLQRLQRGWCASAAAPAGAAAAERSLQQVEAAYRAATEAPIRPPAETLRELVVHRECAAYQWARLQPLGRRLPVWLWSELQITDVRLPPAGGPALAVKAHARTVHGPVRDVRITFSQGMHMSCFGPSDSQGIVACTLVDTHPHGPSLSGDDVKAHEGPLTATFAGRVTDEQVDLPAVVERPMPGSFARRWHWPSS